MAYLVRRIVCILLATAIMATARGENEKLPTIGEVWSGDASIAKPFDKAFRSGLRDLGYVEGKNVRILAACANGDVTRVRALVEEMVARRVDVLVVGARTLRIATDVTKTVPIVCPSMGDPLIDGLVASLAQPGGNVTGLYAQAHETQSKRLELAMEVVPGLKTLGVLFDASDPIVVRYADDFRAVARNAGVAVKLFGARSLDDLQAVLLALDQNRPQALVIFSTPFTYQSRNTIMNLVAQRIPVIGEGRDFALAGAVVTYAPDFYELYRKSASYVDRILQGANAGDLPIEQPTRFELIANLKAAKKLGMSIPKSILLRADDVIK